MAKYKIHSTDGGYVPPFETVYSDSLDTTAPVIEIGDTVKYIENGGYTKCAANEATHICASVPGNKGWYETSGGEFRFEFLAIRISDNIVWEDENGNRVRLG